MLYICIIREHIIQCLLSMLNNVVFDENNEKLMRNIPRFLMPVVVLVLCVGFAYFLMKTAPEPKRKPAKSVVPMVDVLELQQADYRVSVASTGTIKPHTQSNLVAEAAGRVVYASPNFTNGGFIEQGELLISLDPAEYVYAVANTKAALSGISARLRELDTTAENLKKSLAIEGQQLALAERQFKRHSQLRKQGTVSQSALDQSEREYLLRKSSLQSLENSLALIPAQRQILQADLKLKQAQLASAQLDLDRTRIKAPYAGRVLEQRVDLGQSVSKGSVLAAIYAVDYVEVRLPISDFEASFLTLPDGRGDESQQKVTLSVSIAGNRYQWAGRIMRTEGMVDARTRQLFLIAQVDNPYAASPDGRPPLMVGQFVEAEIPGRLLQDVIILPRKVMRAGDEVLVVTPDNRIERRNLEITWRDQGHVVVRTGLSAGDRVSLTQLPYAPNGSQVKISGAADAKNSKPVDQKPAGVQ